MGNSFTFNSVDMSSYGVTVQKTEFPLVSRPVIDIQQAAYGRAGSYNQRQQSREFNIPVLIEGTSKANLFNKIDSMASLFNQESEQRLSFDYYLSDRYWLARYLGGLETVRFLNESTAEATLQFVAPDPIAYSTIDSTSTATITGVVFNHVTGTLIGNTVIAPVITLTATNGALGVSISGNQVTGTLTYGLSLSNGHKLRIDSANYLVQKSTNGGASWTSAMTNISGSFPKLLGGVANTINVSGIANGGSMSLVYTGRFL